MDLLDPVSDTEARSELLEATDEAIADAVSQADPMVLRGLLYQLTGSEEVRETQVKTTIIGYSEAVVPATEADDSLLRRKAVEFLIAYRDAGAGDLEIGHP